MAGETLTDKQLNELTCSIRELTSTLSKYNLKYVVKGFTQVEENKFEKSIIGYNSVSGMDLYG